MNYPPLEASIIMAWSIGIWICVVCLIQVGKLIYQLNMGGVK